MCETVMGTVTVWRKIRECSMKLDTSELSGSHLRTSLTPSVAASAMNKVMCGTTYETKLCVEPFQTLMSSAEILDTTFASNNTQREVQHQSLYRHQSFCQHGFKHKQACTMLATRQHGQTRVGVSRLRSHDRHTFLN